VAHLSQKISGRTGCLAFIVVFAIVIAILVVSGINAMPGNELAETIPTLPN